MDDLKVGMIVRLKSGGPAMTIETLDSPTSAICAWFQEGKLQRDVFHFEALKEVKGIEKPIR